MTRITLLITDSGALNCDAIMFILEQSSVLAADRSRGQTREKGKERENKSKLEQVFPPSVVNKDRESGISDSIYIYILMKYETL